MNIFLYPTALIKNNSSDICKWYKKTCLIHNIDFISIQYVRVQYLGLQENVTQTYGK